MSERSLPAGLERLEPLVADWAIDNERDRRAKRVETPMEELEQFYRAVMGDWDAISTHLKASPATGLDPQTERLLYIAMTAMECGIAVSVFKRNDSPHAADFRRLLYLHEA